MNLVKVTRGRKVEKSWGVSFQWEFHEVTSDETVVSLTKLRTLVAMSPTCCNVYLQFSTTVTMVSWIMEASEHIRSGTSRVNNWKTNVKVSSITKLVALADAPTREELSLKYVFLCRWRQLFHRLATILLEKFNIHFIRRLRSKNHRQTLWRDYDHILYFLFYRVTIYQNCRSISF